jgi:hypothetical protein
MTRSFARSFVALALTSALVGPFVSQRSVQAQAADRKLIPPAKVSIVIERYQADKKVASMPYSLWVTGGATTSMSNGSVRIGVDVPIGSTTSTRSTTGTGSSSNNESTVPQYRNIGTSIDCYLTSADEGRYDLRVNLNDTSLYDPQAARDAALVSRGLAAPPPKPLSASAFRTFSFNNTMRMRDGETAEFITATDKITGEIVKAIVTLSVAK